MSIITDALKKAERERELKAKRALQDTAFATAGGDKSAEMLLAQSAIVERHIEQGIAKEGIDQAVFRRPAWYWPSQFQMISLLVFGGFVCALILFALPGWPRIGENFSISWQPFENKDHSRASYNSSIFGKKEPISGEASVSPSQFTLSGISSTGNDHYAIVNGTIIQKGGSVDGAYVKDISNKEVVLETKNGELRLKIPSSF